MSRKALAPVAVIAHEARRITDRNLDTRLPVSETNDELSHLSITLNHMLGRIDFAFRSVREFTANASHELRTPLARLRTQVEIALFRPRDPEEYRDVLDHVLQDAVEMSGLVENLLTLARAEAGSEVLRLAPVNLNSLLQDIAKEWNPVAERLSIDLRVLAAGHANDLLPLFVLGDRISLLRLLRIFLDNSCKFTPAGGFVIVNATCEEATVVLTVRDSGIGIADEHQTRVFERFYRVSGDTGRHTSGAGLGLSLAKWIAEQHHTTIMLASGLGQGTTFKVALTRLHESDLSQRQALEHAAS
jgi:signal transduction histidine kinase